MSAPQTDSIIGSNKVTRRASNSLVQDLIRTDTYVLPNKEQDRLFAIRTLALPYAAITPGSALKVMKNQAQIDNLKQKKIEEQNGKNRDKVIQKLRSRIEELESKTKGILEQFEPLTDEEKKELRDKLDPAEAEFNSSSNKYFFNLSKYQTSIDELAKAFYQLMIGFYNQLESHFHETELALETAQDALMRALHGFNPLKGLRPSTYISNAIVRNLYHGKGREAKLLSKRKERNHPGYHELSKGDTENNTFNLDLIDSLNKFLDERKIPEGVNLTDREIDVLRMRFKEDKTLQEIGNHFSVTKERIRQIETDALAKLARHYEDSPLKRIDGNLKPETVEAFGIDCNFDNLETLQRLQNILEAEPGTVEGLSEQDHDILESLQEGDNGHTRRKLKRKWGLSDEQYNTRRKIITRDIKARVTQF